MPYKDLEKRKSYHTEYMKGYRERNRERIREINKKSEKRPERKAYVKKWQKESPKFKKIRKKFQDSEKSKEYQREWSKNNKDKVKKKLDKFRYSAKGVLNQIKKGETRRNKFRKLSGVYYNRPNKELIKIVDERDKVCVYCGCEFSKDKNSKKYRSYDHLNAFKKHSIINTVKCCISCNSSKIDKNVWEWLKLKKYKPSKIIYELAKDL